MLVLKGTEKCVKNFILPKLSSSVDIQQLKSLYAFPTNSSKAESEK